jgi:hypothetical protein
MLPDATGRYCNSCQKPVIDFTEKTDEEIQQYILNNFNQPLCGRFKNTQIQRIVIDLPQNIFSIKMPFWMRFLLACLIIFGISIFPFETTIAGKTPVKTSYYQGEPIAAKNEKRARIFKKKHRKKIRRSRDILWDIEIWSGHTMGFMTTPSSYPPEIHVLNTDVPIKINYESSVQQDSDRNRLPPKEQPRPAPPIPTEFILPSILLFRKENNNQTMD